MAARVQQLVLALVACGVGSTLPGCTPVCDEDDLPGVAAAFEARDPQSRLEGFERLGRACPSMPRSLASSLRAEFELVSLDQQMKTYSYRNEDSTWAALQGRVCARDPDEELASGGSFDARVRASCNLERYGLLTADDPFIWRDLTVVMLYEWLVSGRVEPARARDVVWPLLSASASPEQLEALCLDEGKACEHVIATWGLQPPRAVGGWELTGGPRLLVTPTAPSVDRTAVPELHGGEAPLALIADHTTPFGTIVDTLFTATRAGAPAKFELGVMVDDRLEGIGIEAPSIWRSSEPHREPSDGALDLTFVVHRDALEAYSRLTGRRRFPLRPDCEPSLAGCHDLEAITDLATRMKNLWPRETTAYVRVADDVPLQTVVSLLDAIRGGRECRIRAIDLQSGEIPPECLFHEPIVDVEPPLHARLGDVFTLELGEPTVERDPLATKGGPSDQALRAAFAAGRAEIIRCLHERPEALADLHHTDRIRVTIARSPTEPERSTGSIIQQGAFYEDLEGCVVPPLGIERDPSDGLDVLSRDQVTVVIPIRLRVMSRLDDTARPD